MSPQPTFCPYCGSAVVLQDVNCAHCGEQLPVVAEESRLRRISSRAIYLMAVSVILVWLGGIALDVAKASPSLCAPFVRRYQNQIRPIVARLAETRINPNIESTSQLTDYIDMWHTMATDLMDITPPACAQTVHNDMILTLSDIATIMYLSVGTSGSGELDRLKTQTEIRGNRLMKLSLDLDILANPP